jgi:cellulose synthase (UDP-forming)
LRRRRILRPVDAKLVSWEIWLFSFTRWPWVAWGVIVALKLRVWPKQMTFKVTPKGEHGLVQLPLRLVSPYIAVSALTSAAALLRSSSPAVHGYVLLCLLAAATYLVVAGLVIGLHAHESRRYSGATWLAVVPTIVGPAVAFAWGALLFAAAAASVFHL